MLGGLILLSWHPAFFLIGQTKRRKQQKLSRLIRQKEVSTFSVACYFLWLFFVLLIILY